MRTWCFAALEPVAYCNNDWNCYALHEAAALRERLGAGTGLERPVTDPAATRSGAG